MSTSETPNLILPYIQAAQAQKHVTHNEAIRTLDAIVQLAVLDRNLSAPPVSAADGDRYIVSSAPTGSWTGQANKVAAFQDGAWSFYAPKEGWTAWIADEDTDVVFDGSAWILSGDPSGTAAGLIAAHTAAADPHPAYLLAAEAAAALGGQNVQNVAQLGVNATADATNKLSISSSAILFNHAGAGIQEKLNKNTAADTASLLFQTGFSGRAEFGTTGDDNLHLKVSPDGSTWKEAMVVDRSTGAATFAFGSGRTQVDVFTASGSWSKPAWARRIEIFALGGGGGGGSGRRGAAASARSGGGGGAAGGRGFETFTAGDIGSTLTISIGAGGNGGAAQSTNDTNGLNGTNGGATTITDGTTNLVAGTGGGLGGGGTATGATAGLAQPVGFGASNPGGAGSITAAGGAGSFNNNSNGSGGGAGGGTITAADAVFAGGVGGIGYVMSNSNRAIGGVAGATGGGAGGNGNAKAWQRGCGSGGGGGGPGNTTGTVAGGNGGVGGDPGGGGGGGVASTNGANSGAGGAGGRGEVWIVSYA